MSNVNIQGKGVYNVVYVATEHDSVYALDADGARTPGAGPLWSVSFINPAAGVTTVPAQDTGCGQIVPEIGITSTPVIDAASGTIYVVAMTKETSGGAVNYVQRLHALDITTGAERPGSPVVIQATYPGTGEGGSTVVFDPKSYKQRPGLLLLNGVVYTTWSSHCDIGTYHGWIIGYDATTLRQAAVYCDTPNGSEGSFWQGGAAPAADAAGNMYVVSGNGTFDYASGGPDLGESYIKLSTGSGLSVADYFTPFNYDALNRGDVDTGSAGVALLPDEAGGGGHPHLMVSAGKEGRIYLLDRDNMGKFQAGSDSQIVQSMANAVGPLFGIPAYFNGSVYFGGSFDHLKAFAIANGRLSTAPTSTSRETFAFPGCVPTVSSSGNANGIVWVLDPSATLRAYDAADLGRELYNSDQNSARDGLGSYVKFSVPTVANGKVFAGTQGALVVYGLLNGSTGTTLAASNAAGGATGGAAPGSIVSIYGSGLANGTQSAAGLPLPSTLAGASIDIAGLAAPLYFASPAQINAQVPFEAAPGAARLTVSVDGQMVATTNLSIQPTAPGIFVDPQGRAAAFNEDGSLNAPDNPAAAGTPLTLYTTGLGAVDQSVPSGAAAPLDPLAHATAGIEVKVGGVPADVLFAGLAPTFAGLYQLNIQLPMTGPGEVPLQITAGGAASNVVTISLR